MKNMANLNNYSNEPIVFLIQLKNDVENENGFFRPSTPTAKMVGLSEVTFEQAQNIYPKFPYFEN